MSLPPPIFQVLAEIVADRWSEPFLIDSSTGESWTYERMFLQASSVALNLQKQGLREGDRVALILSNSPEYVIAYLTILLGGFIAIPINAALPESDFTYVMGQVNPAAVVLDSSAASPLKDFVSEAKILALQPAYFSEKRAESEFLPRQDGVLQTLKNLPDRILSINYTSGTTGRPKGVVHRSSILFGCAHRFNIQVGLTSASRMMHVLPMSYMAGFLNTLICPVMAGGSVIVGPPFDARQALKFWETPIRYGANTFWLVPSMCAALLTLDRGTAGTTYTAEVKPVFCVGTAPLPARVQHDFEAKYKVQLLESYGLSETLFVATNSPLSPRRPGSVGRLLEGVNIIVMGEDGNPSAPGENGDLKLLTNFQMEGYYLDGAVASSVAGEPFDTGDIGHLDSDSYLYITGRKKDLIIRGGLNISPRTIEEVLLQHPAVKQVSVLGLPHDLKGEEIVAFVDRAALTAEHPSLTDYCRQKLSAPYRPDRFVAVDQFPVGVSGKIQKHRLKELLALPKEEK